MGHSTRRATHRGSPFDQEFRRRNAVLLLTDDRTLDEAVTIAGIRETVRMWGVDRVRGL